MKKAKKSVGKEARVGADRGEQTETADHREHAGDQGRHGAEPVDEASVDAERQSTDGHRPGQKGQTRLQRAVVEHVLQVERAEEEGRVHTGDQKAPHDARARQAPRAEHAQRHDRVRDPRLESQESAHQHHRERPEAEHRARAPALSAGFDDGVDGGHQRGGDQQRAKPVDMTADALARISGNQEPREDDGRHADRQVDKEDPVPAEDLGQSTPGQEPERSAGDRHEHVCAHRPSAVCRLGKLGDDDREDHRRLNGRTNSLHEPSGDQRTLVGRQPAHR